MYQLGYACINMVSEISVNRSCIAKTFREKGVQYAIELAMTNLNGVLEILKWNERHGIRFYRMSSDMFPQMTNPEFCGDSLYAYDLAIFTKALQKIGNYAKAHNHRLTFHPSQYNQIGAISKEVFEKTCRDLQLHADILDIMGCGPESVLVVHGGGTFNDKPATIARWIKQFSKLPIQVQNRIAIENCEFQYNYKDVLYIAQHVKRPVIFDTHHHACYYKNLNLDVPDPASFIKKIIKTWNGVRPKVHISNQDPEKRLGAHSKFVAEIPEYLRELDIDIMIEAKMKEQAVLRLYAIYCNFNDAADKVIAEWTPK